MGILLKERSIVPGFGLTLGYTVFYLSVIVLIPIAVLVFSATALGWHAFIAAVTSSDVIAAYRVSFTTALVAALINAIIGPLIAWVLVRYHFPFRRIVDGLIDLPFALPTAVAGITLTEIYGPKGMFGHWFAAIGIKTAFSPLGIVIALVFIGLPFVVRTVQPVLENLGSEMEEAAGSLGANRWRTFLAVVFPEIWPAIATGFALSFARGVGEYGSVVFISGNIAKYTVIAPLLIVSELDQYDYAKAAAIAVVMLGLSFIMLVLISQLQRFSRLRGV
jgi:sulfate transport system permease protein